MATAVTPTVRLQVRDRAQRCCEYCRLPEGFGFMPHEIDHIIAEQQRVQERIELLALGHLTK